MKPEPKHDKFEMKLELPSSIAEKADVYRLRYINKKVKEIDEEMLLLQDRYYHYMCEKIQIEERLKDDNRANN